MALAAATALRRVGSSLLATAAVSARLNYHYNMLNSGVTLENIAGNIRVNNQNGAIDVTASNSGCKDIVLKTSFSHIAVRVPANAGYKVDAHTSFGHITTELPITASGTLGGGSLSGTIGNGACSLGLTNSNGNIEITRAP